MSQGVKGKTTNFVWQFIIELAKVLAKELNANKKVGGADFLTEAEVTSFLATLYAIAQLPYNAVTAVCDGIGYNISDYKVIDAFSGLVMPRGVYQNVGYGMLNIMVCDGGAVVTMNPVEFAQFQEKVLAKYRKSDIALSGNVGELSSPIRIDEAMTNVMIDGFVHCEDINRVSSIPVALSVRLAEDSFFGYPSKLAVNSLVHDIVTKLA